MLGGMYELDRLPNFDVQNLGSVIFVIDAQVRAGPSHSHSEERAQLSHPCVPGLSRPSKATTSSRHGSEPPAESAPDLAAVCSVDAKC